MGDTGAAILYDAILPASHFDLVILGSDRAALHLAHESALLGASVAVVRCNDSHFSCKKDILHRFCTDFPANFTDFYQSGWEIDQFPTCNWQKICQIADKCDCFAGKRTELVSLGVVWFDNCGRFSGERTISVRNK